MTPNNTLHPTAGNALVGIRASLPAVDELDVRLKKNMKTITIFAMMSILSTFVFADQQMPFGNLRIGEAETGNAYVVSIPNKQGGGYGLLCPSDSADSYFLHRVSVASQLTVKNFIGKFCKISAKAIKDEQGSGTRLEVTEISDAEQAAP